MAKLPGKLGRLLSDSEYFRHVMTMVIGTGLAQAIPVVTSPIISRVFTPDDFGVFALFFSWVSIAAVLATARYEQAIVLPEEDAEAVNVLALGGLICLYVSAILFAFVFLFGTALETRFSASNTQAWLSYLPLTVLIVGFYNVTYSWAVRQKAFRLLALSNVMRNGVYVSAAIVWAVTGLPGQGLIVGHILGFALALFVQVILFQQHLRQMGGRWSLVRRSEMKRLAIRYIRFPKIMIPARFLEVVATELPVIMMAALFGPFAAGGYVFAKRIIQLPVSLVARATADVFRQKASREFAINGNCSATFAVTVRNLALVAGLPFLVLALISPALFAFVFGENWRMAGEFAQILTLMVGLQFVVNPVSSMFMIAEQQHLDLYLQGYLVTGSALALYLGYSMTGSPKASVILYAFVVSIKYALELFMAWRLSRGGKVFS